MRIGGVVALAAGFVQCATMGGTVRQRASAEFDCPEARVQTRELGGGAYRADACGHRATYECDSHYDPCGFGGRGITCHRTQ